MEITRQLLKYFTVAALTAASDWVLFTVLLAGFGGAPIAAQGTSRIAGGVVSFTANKCWSFQSRGSERTFTEVRRFLTLFIISYFISLALFSALTFVGTWPYWAKLVTDTSCFFFNFVMMRLWVYRRPQFVPSASTNDSRLWAKGGNLSGLEADLNAARQ